MLAEKMSSLKLDDEIPQPEYDFFEKWKEASSQNGSQISIGHSVKIMI